MWAAGKDVCSTVPPHKADNFTSTLAQQQFHAQGMPQHVPAVFLLTTTALHPHLVVEEAELALQRLLLQVRPSLPLLLLLLIAIERGVEDVRHAAVLGAQVPRVVLLRLHLQR